MRTCIHRATACGAVRPPREAAPALRRAAHQPAEARGGLISERRERVDEPQHIPGADPRLRWGAGVSAAAPRTEAFPNHFRHPPRSAACPRVAARPAAGTCALYAYRASSSEVLGTNSASNLRPRARVGASPAASPGPLCVLPTRPRGLTAPPRLGIAHGAMQPRGRNRRSRARRRGTCR